MKTLQAVLEKVPGELPLLFPLSGIKPDLVLVFGSVAMLTNATLADALENSFPDACRIGCSTAGEVAGTEVNDGTVVVTAIRFDHAKVKGTSTELRDMADSRAAGERLGEALAAPGLKTVLVFGQGVNINGSALVSGLTARLGNSVVVSGGLAGDGGAFAQTWIFDNDGASSSRITAVGLSGESLEVAYGCFGGWQAFGPTRKVTRSENNVLFELDGEPALDVYKRYLGDHARDLPASGLLFPFEMLQKEGQPIGLFRTILGVDEGNGSLTLAGEIDPNGYLRLMHAQTDKLVDGAETAALQITKQKNPVMPSADSLTLLVSCVGRKLVMGGRVDEEIEAVADVLGQNTIITGFYSYGEISPMQDRVSCALHNQTMTITSISESP